ncbi:disintegrin and metalloproteinase domain-containing protein 9 isoform X2 [Salminus brasiliensis]|uniref:disintegrin and metalloproteinase domain-containing protein 9 isoform X2 n=1 Tax=Salminus brasiliensis TaxID=930266 RepID=UPI003B83698D
MSVLGSSRLFRTASVLFLLCQLWDCSEGSASQTSQFSSYEVSIPKRISRQRREQDAAAGGKVSYIIPAQGKEHVVVLEKNDLLLPADFTVYSYAKDGSLVTERPNMKEHCHYQGYVEDMAGSSAALSLCSGLRGVIHMENTSLGIEPLEGSVNNEHLVYRLEDVKAEPLTCGTPHSEHPDNQASPGHTDNNHAHNITPGQPVSHLIRKKRAIMHQTHYVELLLVVDVERFNFTKRNQTAVREEMVQLANYVDSMYVPLNIRVVLVGLEIWSVMNPISTVGSAGEVLGRFTQWREKELVPRRRHDSAQLILSVPSHTLTYTFRVTLSLTVCLSLSVYRKKGFGETAGMAFVGTACSRSHGGGINAFTNKNVMPFASIVAHELGHNLGMNHDDGRSCKCKDCIMKSGATGSRNFSSCSADDFEKMILNNGGRCLLNIPRPDEAYNAPFCGNKLVDMGEECDCGSEEECRNDPCCEPKTCKLRAGAECAFGVCCKHCRFLPGGTVCRSSTDECDLPEYCNGSSSLCQSDVFKQNGHPCRQDQAYCYNGQCQHYDSQCQAIFGPKAKVAPETCFKDVNSKGDRFGNCGYQTNGFKKCESRNALCGKLQCKNVQANVIFGIKPSIIQTPEIGGTTCWGVDFLLGPDVPDPGMVNEGTKCEENKVCLNYECRSADELNYDCDVQKKCHGHGVCNSNKNCHCDNGWEPPFCEAVGYGGSIDSGPSWNDKDTSTRDGLLVFFFLVLPLLALGLFVFFRRNELQQRFCRKKRSQGYESDSRPQTNNSRTPANQRGNPSSIVKDGVVQTSTTSSVPAYATRPPRPAFTRPPPPAAHLLPQRPAPPPPV